MQWLPHHLLSLCLSGALLLAIAWGEEMYGDYAYDVSPTSDYDENSTIPFFIYSNTTNFDLEEILKGVQDDFTQEPEDQTTPPDVSTYDGAPRLTSPSLLLSLCLPCTSSAACSDLDCTPAQHTHGAVGICGLEWSRKQRRQSEGCGWVTDGNKGPSLQGWE